MIDDRSRSPALRDRPPAYKSKRYGHVASSTSPRTAVPGFANALTLLNVTLYCTASPHASSSTYHIWQQCNVLHSWQSARHRSKTAQAFCFEWFECW